jgi:hypothetical protein
MSRRVLLQQRVIHAFVLVVLPTLPGCLLPFAVPKVSQTPLLNLGPEADQIHVFRVDDTLDFVDIGGVDHLTYSEITSNSGWLLPRTKLSATYGFYVYSVLSYPCYISHSLGLKLYRPGYELVELDSWEQPGKIVWNEAPDLASQEKVLDKLFLMKPDERWDDLTSASDKCLSPGSASPEHQRVLLFAAAEYERLASRLVANGTEEKNSRARLEAKASKLRELAAKVEPPPSLLR